MGGPPIGPRTCLACGQPFKPIRRTQVYCSKACSGLAHRTRVTRTCQRCGVTFEVARDKVAAGKGKYCSKACAFPGPVERVCEGCGKTFRAPRWEVETLGWWRFCSMKCREKRKQCICKSCGEVFEVWESQDGVYCSVACRGLGRRNRVSRACAWCGTEFESPASTHRVFCSRSCNTEARKADPAELERVRQMQRDHLASKEPTKPERALYALMDEVFGSGAWQREHFVFKRWTVDACVQDLKLIVQADGDYWHGLRPEWQDHPMVKRNMANDRAQNAYVARTDWTMLRFWEHDLLLYPDGVRVELFKAALQAVSPLSDDTVPEGADSKLS